MRAYVLYTSLALSSLYSASAATSPSLSVLLHPSIMLFTPSFTSLSFFSVLAISSSVFAASAVS